MCGRPQHGKALPPSSSEEGFDAKVVGRRICASASFLGSPHPVTSGGTNVLSPSRHWLSAGTALPEGPSMPPPRQHEFGSMAFLCLLRGSKTKRAPQFHKPIIGRHNATAPKCGHRCGGSKVTQKYFFHTALFGGGGVGNGLKLRRGEDGGALLRTGEGGEEEKRRCCYPPPFLMCLRQVAAVGRSVGARGQSIGSPPPPFHSSLPPSHFEQRKRRRVMSGEGGGEGGGDAADREKRKRGRGGRSSST